MRRETLGRRGTLRYIRINCVYNKNQLYYVNGVADFLITKFIDGVVGVWHISDLNEL